MFEPTNRLTPVSNCLRRWQKLHPWRYRPHVHPPRRRRRCRRCLLSSCQQALPDPLQETQWETASGSEANTHDVILLAGTTRPVHFRLD